MDLVPPGTPAQAAAPVFASTGRRAGAEAVNPRHTFDQFVIGDGNHLAHAAALAVAELPGLAYNPLYICGPPGLGKTHLLHSIANYLADCGDTTVRYTTAEAFTNHFLAALHGARHRRVQGRLPRRGRAARRRRPVPRGQGAHGAGVLPHLQRAPPGRRPGRPHLGPPAARHDRPRGPPARALRGRPAVRRRRARPHDAPHHPAQAGPAGRDRRRRPRGAGGDRRPRHGQRARARGSAHPRRRLRARSPAGPSPPSSPRRCSTGLYPGREAGPAERPRHPGADRRGLRALRSRSSSPPAARPPSPGRARWRCTSPASSRSRPCPRSARRSAGATTPPSSTPAGAPRSSMAADPEAYEAVRRLGDGLRRRGRARVTPPTADRLRGSCPQPIHRPRPHPSGRFRRHAHHEHPL